MWSLYVLFTSRSICRISGDWTLAILFIDCKIKWRLFTSKPHHFTFLNITEGILHQFSIETKIRGTLYMYSKYHYSALQILLFHCFNELTCSQPIRNYYLWHSWRVINPAFFHVTLVHANFCMHILGSLAWLVDMQPWDLTLDFKMVGKSV